jgi:MYXO-CTERM domain-containing protein
MRTSVLAVIAIAGAASRADAFCGFYVGGAGAKMYNNATEVVLMRHGTTTVLSMQNNYQGPPDKFALVVPVPAVIKEAQVKTLPRDLFDKVDTLGAPRLVEYWEHDPCGSDPVEDYGPQPTMMLESEGTMSDSDESDHRDYHVKVEARFSVGEYNIEVLSAEQSTGLDAWLRDHHYTIPEGAEPLLRPYVEQGMKWFIAKVDPKKVTFKPTGSGADRMATLSPLRFYYDTPEFTLPIRLGLANSAGTQDLIVNILAPNTRYEVANYPNATIPTNLQVNDNVRTQFGEFYAALFDHTLEKLPGAVVTEYSWDSGSCDPCPGPTLDANDLATFGADVIGRLYKNTATYGFTLTRLHARYGKDVKNDLVFRSVEPIGGGRGVPDAKGAMAQGVDREGTNNFQGRYVILHYWDATLTCKSPQRGRWGGPIGQRHQDIAAQAATNTAFAPRGNVQLASFVAADVPAIGLMSSKGAQLPNPIRQPQGCGCSSTNGAGTFGAAIVVALVVLRRRRTTS